VRRNKASAKINEGRQKQIKGNEKLIKEYN
jgi:hypothetical protein